MFWAKACDTLLLIANTDGRRKDYMFRIEKALHTSVDEDMTEMRTTVLYRVFIVVAVASAFFN